MGTAGELENVTGKGTGERRGAERRKRKGKV